MAVDLKRMTRWAMQGATFQRLNPDNTRPTPQRFLGFANTVNLTEVLENGSAPLTIKIDYSAPVTKQVSFSNALNLSRVTVAEAIAALNAADFPNIEFSQDAKTTRLIGRNTSGKAAVLGVEFTNMGTDPVTINAGEYLLTLSGRTYLGFVPSLVTVNDGDDYLLNFTAVTVGVVSGLPAVGTSVSLASIAPNLNADFEAEITTSTQGEDAAVSGDKIQVLGKLAAALDFGQGIKLGGNGLEIISFFGDETVSIGLPKDIKDKEEIDQEGAQGTLTRIVIGAKLQGISPVVTFRQKDYNFVEMVQGGKLNRETGTYDPPLSHETDKPKFYFEVYSPVFNSGTSESTAMAGFEKLLFRIATGIEGDVPIEAKGQASYAYNLTCTEYTDENGVKFPAWQEQILSLTQFDALRLRELSL